MAQGAIQMSKKWSQLIIGNLSPQNNNKINANLNDQLLNKRKETVIVDTAKSNYHLDLNKNATFSSTMTLNSLKSQYQSKSSLTANYNMDLKP